jgi:hypothetical protein
VSADESPIAFAPIAGTAGVVQNEAALESTAGVKAGVRPKLKPGAGAAADPVLDVGVAPKLNAGLVEIESSVIALGAGKPRPKNQSSEVPSSLRQTWPRIERVA